MSPYDFRLCIRFEFSVKLFFVASERPLAYEIFKNKKIKNLAQPTRWGYQEPGKDFEFRGSRRL